MQVDGDALRRKPNALVAGDQSIAQFAARREVKLTRAGRIVAALLPKATALAP